MILRRLEREPFKAVLSSFGIAMAVTVLILGSFIMDALDYLIEFEFKLAQRQDMSVALVEPTSASVIHELERLPGVIRCEPFRTLPVRLRFGHRSRRLGIMGLVPNSELFRLMDADEQVIAIPPGGLLLSAKLAELLDVRVGQTVTVEVQEGITPDPRHPSDRPDHGLLRHQRLHGSPCHAPADAGGEQCFRGVPHGRLGPT